MTWVKLDDGFYDNPKNRALGQAGRDLFVASLCYCAKGLTDGRVEKPDVALIVASAQARPGLVRALVEAGRWIDHGTHYEVTDYLKYNPSKAKVAADREAKVRAGRKGAHSRWDGTSDSTCHDTSDDTSDGRAATRASDGPSRPVPPTKPADDLKFVEQPPDFETARAGIDEVRRVHPRFKRRPA